MFRLGIGGLTCSMTTSEILVIGGTGRTGGRIVQRLRDRGVQVRATSRRYGYRFEWHDPSTWNAALDGVESAYVCYSPDLAFPGVPELIAEFSERARELGVRRLVLLSGRGEEGALASERALQDSGVEWTVVRSAWFAQNFSEHFLLGSVLRGRFVLPAGAVVEPFVDLEDLADVATSALVGDIDAGRVYELTGPRLLSMDDVAEELSTATGRRIEYVPGTPEQFVAAVEADGVSREDAEPVAELFESILDGRNASMTEDLAAALDREPTDFADYARRTAATGVWNVHAGATV